MRIQAAGVRAHGEDVVLVQADRNLAFPDVAAAELVEVTTLRHQDIARLQQVRRLVDELGINVSGVEVILRMSRQIEELQAELAEVRRETSALRQRLGEAYDA